MKCPICGKDLDLQNKQIGTSENGDPIFNEYAICHSCKKQWNLDKQRAKKIAAKKAAEEKAKAEAEPVPLKRRQKLRLKPALLKKKRKLKLRPVPLRRKRKLKLPPVLLKKKRKLRPPPVPLKRNELPAEKQKRVPAKKRLPALLLIKGFQKRKLSVSLKKEPEHAKPLHRKLPLLPLMLLMIPKSRNMEYSSGRDP